MSLSMRDISRKDGKILLRMIQIRAFCPDLHSNAFTLKRMLQLSLKLGLTDSKVIRLNKDEADIAIEIHVDLLVARNSEGDMIEEIGVIDKLYQLAGDTHDSLVQKAEKKEGRLAKKGKK